MQFNEFYHRSTGRFVRYPFGCRKLPNGTSSARLIWFSLLLIVLLPIIVIQGANRSDDDNICERILSKVRSDWSEEKDSCRFEVVSIDRIYQWYAPSEQPVFQVCVVQKFVSKVASGETTTTYIVPSYYMDRGSSQLRKGQQYSHGAPDDKTAYWKGIEEKDRDQSGFRILYPKDLRQTQPQLSEVNSLDLKDITSRQSDSKSPSIALYFFASDPSPVVAGKDFKLVFDWSIKPDFVEMDMYSPSGKLELKKTIRDEDEVLFPAEIYMKFLQERGRFTVTVRAVKTGYSDFKTSLAFDLIDPWSSRGWFILGKPDKEVIYFGEKVHVPVLELSEPEIPMNVYLIGPKGITYDINPGKESQEGKIFCNFDSRVYQRFVTEPGTYRFKVETWLAGEHFITRYAEPFTYLVTDDLHSEIILDGKKYSLRIAPEASDKLWYHEKTETGLRRCDIVTNSLLKKLAQFRRSKDETIRTITAWLQSGQQEYAAFAFTLKPSLMEDYKFGQVFWLNQDGLQKLGISRVVVLDKSSKTVTDENFAKELFRAAAVQYQIVGTTDLGLEISKEDIQYVRSMTANPGFAATFAAQGAKSILTSVQERYKAVFLDMMLADTDSIYLTSKERKTVAQALESAEDIEHALSVVAKVVRKLPSNYVKKLDENWVLVRRGQQWHFLKQTNTPNVGLGIEILDVLVELTHNQVVLKDRADQLRLVDSQITQSALPDKSAAMNQGLNDALQWSKKAYKDGLSNALDKAVEVAKKEGTDAAIKLLSTMSSKANTILLAFEIPNVVFNMDSMYDSNLKAQCAADVLEATDKALAKVLLQAKTQNKLEDWKCVDALYLFALLSKGQFHHHAANMLESAGIGKDAGDFLTQGKTSQWIEGQKNTCKRISSMIDYWENQEGINDCVELMTLQIGSK